MSTFLKRTLSAIVYAALFIGTMYASRWCGNIYIGALLFAAFILFVTEVSAFEYYRIATIKGANPVRWMGYICCTLVSLLMTTGFLFSFRKSMYLLAILVPLLVIATIIARLWGTNTHPFDDIAHTLMPMFYVAMPLGLMPLLHFNCNVMMMVLILIWLNDSGAYIVGSLIGKHKLWQRHSPGKTWEGSIGGMVVCIAAAIFIGPLFEEGMGIWLWVVIALICSVVGTLGDLAESMLKRSAGLKDSGTIMPGHGGLLDRFDSLLAVIPCVAALMFVNDHLPQIISHISNLF